MGVLEETVEYFKSKGVICKKVEDNRPEYGDFIAVFGYGELSREQIMKPIRENDLSIMFFESAIADNQKKNRKEREVL